ncbi:MAG TPA: nuclear transport factor 2 family protein [Rhizobacter sp.]
MHTAQDTLRTNTLAARRFIECFNDNDIAGALDTMADDVRYWLAGKPDRLPSAGDHDKAQIAAVFEQMTSRLNGGLRMWVKNTIAERDQVAMEVESRGELKNGRLYNNEYHMLITLREGKIVDLKEYYDSFHVWDTWYRRDQPADQQTA